MKILVKTLKFISIGCIALVMLLVFAYQQTHYVRIGHVVLNKSFSVNNEYVFSDSTGQEYAFVTTDIISPYDTVKVVMFDNCTEENIYDDMVINYKIVSSSDSKNEK